MGRILNAPNSLTLLRILVIPLFVIAFYSPSHWSHVITTALFLVGAVSDWLDGYLARRLNQISAFGAFLDPVADKLLVVAALVLILTMPHLAAYSFSNHYFAVAVLVIIGREITISALREWMAELGVRRRVAVSVAGKVKTAAQMTAIPLMLFQRGEHGVDLFHWGELLLYLAAILTLWSMAVYVRAAWPDLLRHDRLE